MLKYAGIFILASSLSAYGAHLSSSLKANYILRKEILQLLRDLERSIRYANTPIIEVIRSCRLPALMKSGFCDTFNGCDNAEIAINSTLFCLSEKDREMLCAFFKRFGKSVYGEYELKNCNSLIEYFEKNLAESEKEVNTKSLLYKKIGLIVGILSAIIFI
ncbi:MAG: stage III sporulation protein AB [Clostridia bacterium]|nr:stage III sporulation protein AB [Clostridia bacterium]